VSPDLVVEIPQPVVGLHRAVRIEDLDEDVLLRARADAGQLGSDRGSGAVEPVADGAVLGEDLASVFRVTRALGGGEEVLHHLLRGRPEMGLPPVANSRARRASLSVAAGAELLPVLGPEVVAQDGAAQRPHRAATRPSRRDAPAARAADRF
jgi:hypothetical protein